jgi:hypothetical protein
MRGLAVAVGVAALAVPAYAQDLAATALNQTDVGSFSVYGPAQSAVIDAPAVPGGKALRINVAGKGANPWDAGVISKVTGPVKAGDELIFIIYARLEQGENGAASASLPGNQLSLAEAPYTMLFGGPATVGPKWQMLRARGKADKDYPSGSLNAQVHLATGKQVIDIGPIYVSKASAAAASTPAAAAADLASRIANDPSGSSSNGAKAKLLDDPQAEGGKALRVTVSRKGTNVWDSALESPLKKPVKKGDRLVLRFEARLQEGPGGATTATVPFAAIQRASEPYSSVASGQPALTGTWQPFRYEGRADKDYAAGALKAVVHMGNAKQVIDFGPIVVLNMGQ